MTLEKDPEKYATNISQSDGVIDYERILKEIEVNRIHVIIK